MISLENGRVDRISLSISQQNIYHGVLQDPDPTLYLIGKSYRFHPIARSEFLPALDAAIRDNQIQLCVLAPPLDQDAHPDLVARLHSADIVRVCAPHSADVDGLERAWTAGILGAPLVRYTVHTDADDRVVAMVVHTHHILLDGASTAIIEAALARHLGGLAQGDGAATTLAHIAAAHRHEYTKVAEATERLGAAVQRELSEQAQHGSPGYRDALPGTAARGVLRESVQVSGADYHMIVALADSRGVPLNVLVSAAALAVHASLRQSTQSLLVCPVDNRFGEPQLNIATCLVNSVAQLIRFAPFASVGDVVAMVDRGYVTAARRRWFREERYRRMYLAVSRGAPVEALTVNFMLGRCAAELDRYLSEPPVVTDIGPVEGMTVACIHDDARRTLDFAIWNRVDVDADRSDVAGRIVAALRAMAGRWDQPIALTVGEWFGLDAQGRLELGAAPTRPESSAPAAWYVDPAVDPELFRSSAVDHWIGEIVSTGADLGDVLVFVDDDSQTVIELLIACHLAGCGYSVCATADEVAARVRAIDDHGDGTAHLVDLGSAQRQWVAPPAELVDDRIARAAHDHRLADRIAYVMPTSGSTGRPKLVPVTHGALALFCAAARAAYGWGPADTVLQCAPLTSDISVEEIFVALGSGARVVRSTAMRSGDLPALVRDAAAGTATVLDLPTAIWQLLCADDEILAALGGSALRQVIIGGEAVRPNTIDKWSGSAAGQRVSLVSTYGPTETTVVVTGLPIESDPPTTSSRSRLGHPLVPDSVFVAFGEVVIVGDLVSAGYLGTGGANFGVVQGPDGARYRAFATADRIHRDDAGFPLLAGRRDAVVKIAGKRVDTADVLRRIAAVPEVSDVAVELVGTRLGVWIRTPKSLIGEQDSGAIARIRSIVRAVGVPSFSVVAVPAIPRQPNGKVDRGRLTVAAEAADDGAGSAAAALAKIWSRRLGRVIGPDSSLLDEGIGSLELIRIMPDTRRHLGWQLSILDLIGADTAANVVGCRPAGDDWMDDATADEIAADLTALERPGHGTRRLSVGASETIVVLGATGILGTGVARAVLDLKRRGHRCPEVVFVSRSPLPEHDPWTSLRRLDGVTFARLPDRSDAGALGVLLDEVGAGTVVNCIGDTNVLVPYRELRAANVESVSSIAQACAYRGARMVHLSTFVVNADVTAARVTDPAHAPYPYAASKSMAELMVSRAASELDYTVVRLPRVLGDRRQLEHSADILVAVVDACIALQACPAVPLIEEVTTGEAAARGIIGLSQAPELGRALTVLRGEKVCYTEFLGSFGLESVDMVEWQSRLDRSTWAQENPSRWAVIDAWIGLGTRLAGRNYAEYLAERPTVELDYESVTEVHGVPPSLRDLLSPDRTAAVGN